LVRGARILALDCLARTKLLGAPAKTGQNRVAAGHMPAIYLRLLRRTQFAKVVPQP
jgi:hypothetical protein